jgi:dTDP-4-dehydrorhamnose 3,5-epimerase-like enzyme
LSGDVAKQVFIPPRCGHGFFSKENDTIVVYGQEGIPHTNNE